MAMKCGRCNGTEFEVAMGKAHCTNCGAEVDNEVAAALHIGFGEEDNGTT